MVYDLLLDSPASHSQAIRQIQLISTPSFHLQNSLFAGRRQNSYLPPGPLICIMKAMSFQGKPYNCRLLFSQMKVWYVLCLCKGIILYLIKYLLIVSVTLLSSGTSLLKCVKKFCHTRYSAVLVPYGQGQLSVDCVTQLFNILCND